MDITGTEDDCNPQTAASSSSHEFTQLQVVVRGALMPTVGVLGLLANVANIVVFSHRQMRSQCVNHFFMALALSDAAVLLSSFFVFSLPVYAELSGNAVYQRLAARLLNRFYPVAQAAATASVYLTVSVSAHRYLAICHPFMIRRISRTRVIRATILAAYTFALLFNLPRWWELDVAEAGCNQTTLVVQPTGLMLDAVYMVAYRNAAFTLVMFFLPFGVLFYVNVRIVRELGRSARLRKEMAERSRNSEGPKPVRQLTSNALPSIRIPVYSDNYYYGLRRKAEFMRINSANTHTHPRNRASSLPRSGDVLDEKLVTAQTISPQRSHAVDAMRVVAAQERRESGVTLMLVAVVTAFLVCNLLAFANNLLEVTGLRPSPSVETALVECSTLLVNANAASTLLVYLAFGTKFRAVFRSLLLRLAVSSPDANNVSSLQIDANNSRNPAPKISNEPPNSASQCPIIIVTVSSTDESITRRAA